MTKVFSGIQPTGSLHLGNYLGAIKNWVTMQTEHDSLFCLVDLHAITVPQNPNELRESCLVNYAYYLACGLDPNKSTIFIQSSVPEHTELAWILGCSTPLGWLNRMTQFKDKAGKDKESAALGLYAYPVLMAADILLYHATHVPVGEDQTQHLELARDIAGAFNRQYNTNYFTEPKAIGNKIAARVMSLRDGTKKMSKSDESDFSRINLTDDADTIVQKIKKAKTDALEFVSYDRVLRPEVSNLIEIYCAIVGCSLEVAQSKFATYNNSQLKKELTEVLIENLIPIKTKAEELLSDRAEIIKLANNGADRARAIATKTMQDVRKLVGFYR